MYHRRYFDHLSKPLNARLVRDASLRCPAAIDGYQLFRQQALAEALATRGPYGLVASCLAYHEGNEHLARCLSRIGLSHVREWGDLFDGQAMFRTFTTVSGYLT